MASVTVHTRIARPIGDVFAFVADTRNDPLWAPLVEDVEQVEGDGPGPGAAYLVGQRSGPRVDHVVFTTSEYEPPTRVTWTAKARQFRYRGAIVLSENPDGGTDLTQTNTITSPIPGFARLWSLLAPKVLTSQCRRLKDHLEGADARPEA